MRTLTRLSPLSLGVAGCLAAIALTSSAPAAVDPPPAAPGRVTLDALLAIYDRTAAGPARDKLALEIDQVAGQRYATVSRLYWYRDLDAAKAAARAQQQPILHLRMLGRLDEDLSCANSRLFRATLYANARVSQFLRDNFVLYWSSERPVPRVTIDFGDGRKLERTTTGNSAHYVLDADGTVLDVLPGLYAPAVFQGELAKTLALARTVRTLAGSARAQAIAKFHEAALAADTAAYAGIAGSAYTPISGRLALAAELAPPIRRAQQATIAKAAIEVVDLARIGIDAGKVDRADVAQWAMIGQRIWAIGTAAANERPAAGVLDARSRALITRLHTAGPGAKPTPAAVAAMLARLEQNLVADSALNQFQLRPQIRRRIIRQRDVELASLNAWIYAHVFHTPASDPWLGLHERTDFSGLPGDGLSMR